MRLMSIRDRKVKKNLRLVGIGLATTIVWILLFVVEQEYSFGFIETAVLGLFLLLSLLASVLALIAAAMRRSRTLLYVGVGLGVFLISFVFLGDLVTSRKRDASTQRAQQIIEALNRYRSVRGSYPEDLSSLVPAYLPNIPDTDMGLVRRVPFSYSRRDEMTYVVRFLQPGLIFCEYTSSTRKWLCHD